MRQFITEVYYRKPLDVVKAALTEPAAEHFHAIPLKGTGNQVQMNQKNGCTTSIIFTDNQAAISISHHPEHHSHVKHIDIANHFLHDLINNGALNTVYVNTCENLADLFTKGLSKELHEDLTY